MHTKAYALDLTSACPGAQLAQSIMFIFAATVLSVFDIGKVTINGVVQEPKNEFSSGVLVYVLITGSLQFLADRLTLRPIFFLFLFVS
jgi:hypothetical protein